MSDNVQMWIGPYMIDIGYPMVIVTTQARRDDEYPGEFFLFLQKMPSLKFSATHRSVSGTQPSAGVLEAGVSMTPELVAEQVFEAAKCQIRDIQFETYEPQKHDPSFLRDPILNPVDWKRALLTLRWQGRLPELLIESTAAITCSGSLASFLKALTKVAPLSKSQPHPYQDNS